MIVWVTGLLMLEKDNSEWIIVYFKHDEKPVVILDGNDLQRGVNVFARNY